MATSLTDDDILRRLLFELLERYEQSKSFGKPEPWRRDVILKLNETSFPNAFKHDGRDEYEYLQGAVESLLEHKAVRAIAFPGAGHQVWREIRLGPNEVETAYELAVGIGFIPLEDALQDLQTHSQYLLQPGLPEWITTFLRQVVADAQSASVSRLGTQRLTFKRDRQEFYDALTATVALARGFDGWERVFSERTFGDSKRFLRIRARTADLLVRADPRWEGFEAADSPEIFTHYGLRRRPGFITCAGGAGFQISTRLYQLADFGMSANIPEGWVPALAAAFQKNRQLIISTIENEYPYFAYVEENGGCKGLESSGEVVVYAAGFPSKATLRFLTALAQSPGARFRHWGDADVGGLRIWWYLRRVLDVPIEFFRTTPEWYLKNAEGATQLTDAELKMLSGMRSEFRQFGGPDIESAVLLLDTMLHAKVKIEQERY